MARFNTRREYKKDLYRRNHNIRVPEVRVINTDGAMLGIMPVAQAVGLAKEKGLDLVEISPNAKPPVCKILDYNKYVYEQGKKASEAKKKQAKVTMKELRVKSHIAPHDLEVRMRQIEDFLRKKNQVRFVVVFFGRENQHKDIGVDILNDTAKRMADIATMDGKIQSLGNRMFVTLIPKS